jgi:hypothetical protein
MIDENLLAITFHPHKRVSPASLTSIASKEAEITGRTCEKAKVLLVTNFL